MRALWDDEVPGACDNTLLVAERVEAYDEIFAHRDLTPRFPVPEGETESSWLRAETLRGARRRYGDAPSPEVLARIDHELSVIDTMGFPGYFLVVADICQYARDQGIGLGPGRGSATGSIVAYCTGITQLDPIEHKLLFERFLNPERISMPDVDLDFDDRRRDEMIAYVTRRYGEDRVCQIVTFGTIKAKAAVKDTCRVLGLPYALGDRITKAFPPAAGGKEIPLAAIHDSGHSRHGEAAELRRMYEQEPDVRLVLDNAAGLEGLTRGTGIHAAGVILSAARPAATDAAHRKSLVAVHEHAIDAVIGVKRSQAMGQDSLFGDLGGAEFAVTVPEGEWDRSTLLAYEREMLGLFVSGHPLDGAEHVLRQHRDIGLADLLTSGRTEGLVQVSGIIADLQRKITRQGHAWAVLTLEDHDAAMECLAFPKTYERCEATLAQDRVVSVRGRINVRDETMSIHVEDVTPLDLTGDDTPIVLALRDTQVTPQLVNELKQILTRHHGTAPVHVRLACTSGRTHLLDLKACRVTPGPALYGDLKALLGTAAIGA
ncbi:OB-fold nucleic acid binding domain-containing protein [Dactylosporangium sp. NPDC049742]|uniref:OB-fold nucleic acid binding domain-containing protein n=1 Tax=Dactylosporangium sp. NPDC049742 TaxID=3154737 RepID=UPI00342111C0